MQMKPLCCPDPRVRSKRVEWTEIFAGPTLLAFDSLQLLTNMDWFCDQSATYSVRSPWWFESDSKKAIQKAIECCELQQQEDQAVIVCNSDGSRVMGLVHSKMLHSEHRNRHINIHRCKFEKSEIGVTFLRNSCDAPNQKCWKSFLLTPRFDSNDSFE